MRFKEGPGKKNARASSSMIETPLMGEHGNFNCDPRSNGQLEVSPHLGGQYKRRRVSSILRTISITSKSCSTSTYLLRHQTHDITLSDSSEPKKLMRFLKARRQIRLSRAIWGTKSVRTMSYIHNQSRHVVRLVENTLFTFLSPLSFIKRHCNVFMALL